MKIHLFSSNILSFISLNRQLTFAFKFRKYLYAQHELLKNACNVYSAAKAKSCWVARFRFVTAAGTTVLILSLYSSVF